MGNGISQEQLAAHLEKQEALIRQLQAVVKQQSTSLAAMGSVAVNYDVDGVGPDVPLSDDLVDEVEGLRRAGNVVRKIEEPVDEYEKTMPAEEWTEPTEEEERGFMSVKPWLGAMAKPTGFEYGKTDDMPDVKLELEHVYGYRAMSVRQNAVWIDKRTVLYFSAGVGIVHNIETNTQKFFRGHSDDILCLAYHPGRRIAVTGEKGKMPSVHVWDVDTCEELTKIAGFHSRGVVSVSFSLDGSKIVTVGLDDQHSIAVYDWTTGNCVASDEGDTARILDVRYNMTAEADSNNDFVTVGVKHIKFWSVQDGRLKQKKGLLGNLGERQAFLTVGFSTQYSILGTQNGEMYLFKGRKLAKVVAAHQRSIYGISAYGDSIVTGGRDGYVSRWDMNTFEKTGSINLNKAEDPAVLAHATNYVRAVDCFSGDEVVAGTITSSLYKIKFSTGSVTPLVQAHYGNLSARSFHGELWGIASAPSGQRFASAGEDSTLRVWDAAERKMVASVQLDDAAQCVAWSGDGQYIAVGLQSGTVVFMTADGEVLRATSSRRRRRVQSIKFSPSSKLVAVGSADNVIHIYEADNDFKCRGKLTGHSSVVLKLDWSEDEKYLQTCSQSYELLFFNIEDMKHHTRSRELKDVKWATFTSILGWDVQGIWPKFSDGSDVNAVARSHNSKYLATAEDTGLVKVFQYPCVGGGLDRRGTLNRRPESERATGHSEHVTEVAWTAGDERLVSAGGADLAIMQWRVVRQ